MRVITNHMSHFSSEQFFADGVFIWSYFFLFLIVSGTLLCMIKKKCVKNMNMFHYTPYSLLSLTECSIISWNIEISVLFFLLFLITDTFLMHCSLFIFFIETKNKNKLVTFKQYFVLMAILVNFECSFR